LKVPKEPVLVLEHLDQEVWDATVAYKSSW
jgi:hypothetical protein